jgi:hypothetical protein
VRRAKARPNNGKNATTKAMTARENEKKEPRR